VSFKLTRDQRLLKAHDFSRVFEGAKFRVSCPQILLLGTASDQECARVGLVISKKHVGGAVARNRVKRLCREVFRHRAAQLPAIDIVILAKPGLDALSNEKLVSSLNQLFDGLCQQFNKRKPSRTDAGNANVDCPDS